MIHQCPCAPCAPVTLRPSESPCPPLPPGSVAYSSGYMELLYNLPATAWRGMPVETLLMPDRDGSYTVHNVSAHRAAAGAVCVSRWQCAGKQPAAGAQLSWCTC